MADEDRAAGGAGPEVSGDPSTAAPAAPEGLPARAGPADLLRFFLLMGFTAFGGPVAHLAIMEREAVTRRRWMSREEFVDVMGLLNLIPGPNSTQMVMYFGHRHGTVPGMLAAGLGFIVPAMAITLAITWVYLEVGRLPQGAAVLFGIQPVVVAVIASAMWRFLPQGVRDRRTGLLFGLALAAAFLGVSEVVIILAAGAAGWVWFSGRLAGKRTGGPGALGAGLGWFGAGAAWLGPVAAATPGTLTQLAWAFTKIALVLYGTGYVLVAYMQGELVDARGWLSTQQLLDVIAIGQMTPGPFLTTATAAGMVIAGLPGALLATVAIFLPSFVLVAVAAPRVGRLRASAQARHFLAGINAGVVAVLLAVSVRFGWEIATEPVRLAVAALAFVALERWRASALLLVGLGALFGLAWSTLF